MSDLKNLAVPPVGTVISTLWTDAKVVTNGATFLRCNGQRVKAASYPLLRQFRGTSVFPGSWEFPSAASTYTKVSENMLPAIYTASGGASHTYDSNYPYFMIPLSSNYFATLDQNGYTQYSLSFQPAYIAWSIAGQRFIFGSNANGDIYTSEKADPTATTLRTTAMAGTVQDIAVSPVDGTIVALSASASLHVQRSTDHGLTWDTPKTLTADTAQAINVNSSGRFFVVGLDSLAYYSDDGDTWNIATDFASKGTSVDYRGCAIFDDDSCVAFATNEIYYASSPTGTTSTATVNVPTGTPKKLQIMGHRIYAVSNVSDSPAQAYFSEDKGASWSTESMNMWLAGDVDFIAYDKEGLAFAAVNRTINFKQITAFNNEYIYVPPASGAFPGSNAYVRVK